MSKSRRPRSTSIMTVMAVTDWLILAILEMKFYRVSQKNDFQNAAVALKKKMKRKSGCIVCSIDNQNMHHQWTWRESFLLLTNPVSQQWLPLYQNYIKLVTFFLHIFHHAAMVFASLNSSNHLDMARKRGAPSGSYNHRRVVNPMGLMAVPFTQVPGVQHLTKRLFISDGAKHLYRILFSTESKCFAGGILVTEGFYAFRVSPKNNSPESWFESGRQVKTWN